MFPIGDENDHSGIAFVTIALIAINVLAWLMEISHPSEAQLQSFIQAWGVVPREYAAGRDIPPQIPYPYWSTLFTSIDGSTGPGIPLSECCALTTSPPQQRTRSLTTAAVSPVGSTRGASRPGGH